MLSRPSDNGHTPFGDIFLSESPDLKYWGCHRYVMGTIKGDASAWQSTKIGAGSVPIETSEGWLLIYHGVINTCNGLNCCLLRLRRHGDRTCIHDSGPSDGVYGFRKLNRYRLTGCRKNEERLL